MKYNYLDKISPYRLAGINYFLLLNIRQTEVRYILLKRKEPFYFLQVASIGGYEIIYQGCFSIINDSFPSIFGKISSLVTEKKLNDVYTGISIEEYRHAVIKLPADTEDIDVWFINNASKYLPDEKSSADFYISYKQLKEDDSHKTFIVVFARKNYVDEIVKDIETSKINIISICPFNLSLMSYFNPPEVNKLLIEIYSEKLTFTYYPKNQEIFTGDLYISKEHKSLYYNELLQLKQILINNVQGYEKEQLEIYINTDKEDINALRSSIVDIFNPVNINRGYNELNENLTSLIYLNKVLENNSDEINLLPEAVLNSEREKIEKKTLFAFVIRAGGIVMSLLLLAFVLQSFVFSQIENRQEYEQEIENNRNEINLLRNENTQLNKNVQFLNQLKSKRAIYSNLLLRLSVIIPEECILNKVDMVTEENNKVKISISGKSRTSENISAFIKKLESNEDFGSIVLSSIVNSDNVEIHDGGMEFKITAEYIYAENL